MSENTNLFSHDLLAKKISAIFDKYDKNGSFVIAINGAWGTGKTHLMNNVLSVLNDTEYIKVNFNAWRFSKKEEIWKSLLICILHSCREYVYKEENKKFLGWHDKDIDIISSLLDDTERALYTAFTKETPGEICIDTGNLLKTGLNVALKFVPWGNFGSEVINKLLVKKDDNGERIESKIEKEDIENLWGIFTRSSTKRNIEKITGVEQFRSSYEDLLRAILEGDFSCNSFKQKLTKHNKNIKLIVAIDDLDRCLPENVLEVLEAIKLFVDFSNTFFMIAMDSNIIQHGLNMRYVHNEFQYITAKDYCEKMIDLSFNIPALLKSNLYLYIQYLSKYSNDYFKNFELLTIALRSNLRAWERYVYRADFNRDILESIANDNIFEDESLLDSFLKLQCFSYQWPELYSKIYDYSTYIMLEEKSLLIANYEKRELQDILNYLKTLSINEEILNLILDKRIIDYIRKEPELCQVNNKDLLNLFFTFDKVIDTNA